jgi:abhydrolase domain-containing protein 17
MLKSLIVITALSYLAIAAIAFLFADRLIFLPPRSSYAEGQLPVVHVDTEDGARIATLHLPKAGADFTLLYSHGNAEDIGQIGWVLTGLRDQVGVSVLAYDYRGYGLSSGGSASAAGTLREIEAVYRHAVRDLGIDPERLIVHGRSVGTGPALHLASRETVGAVILESGFTSAFRVVTRVPVLPFDRFPNLRNVQAVSAPVLVIHGELDEVIPFSHGRRLLEAAPEPKRHFWVEGAGHNDLLQVAGDEYWRVLREFVATLR